jgi:hypothetical protein
MSKLLNVVERLALGLYQLVALASLSLAAVSLTVGA